MKKPARERGFPRRPKPMPSPLFRRWRRVKGMLGVGVFGLFSGGQKTGDEADAPVITGLRGLRMRK
jgi:hypothetical protein